MKRALLSILLILTCFYGFAIEPPILQCVEQMTNPRNLRITWSWATMENVGTDDRYTFYVNYQEISTLSPQSISGSYVTSSVITLPAGMLADQYSCTIVAHNDAGETCTSNTLKTMLLNLLAHDLNGDSTAAKLEWSPVSSSTSGGTWDSHYYIFKRRNFEATAEMLLIDSIPVGDGTTTLTYIDPSDVCHNLIFYQIGITNHISTSGGSSCIFKSNINNILLYDSLPPSTPVLDSVSVTEDNHIMLGFHAPDPYMMCYRVYFLNENEHRDLATVYNSNFWLDESVNPGVISREFFIAVLDSCTNSSPQTDSGQRNILLQTPTPDACHRTARLAWNAYKNMHGNVGGYRVYLSTDNGATYQRVATTTSTSFTLENLLIDVPYRAYVQAFNTDSTITSSSNRIDFIVHAEESQDMTYIRHVSVINNSYISILVHTSGDEHPFQHLFLERSEDGQSFELFASLPFHNSPEYHFLDSTANFNKEIYYYRTYVTGDCDVASGISNISHNILLTGSSTSAHDCDLEWNDYGTWAGNVDHYSVSRRTEYDSVFLELTNNIPPSIYNAYVDDVSMLFELGSRFTYYVTAYESPNEFGFSDESVSNQITLQQESSMIIPNAFTPNYDGHNDIFLPSNAYVSNEGYELIIVSRWGKVAFRTQDPTAGWNGKDMNGNPAPVGVYTYIINYKNAQGESRQERGSVTLIR